MAALDALSQLGGFGYDPQAGAGGSEGTVNVIVSVGGRDKEGFELRRRQKNAAGEHFSEKCSEARGVALLGTRVVADRRARKEQREKRA